MSYIVYASILCECPSCKAKVCDQQADMKVLWRNDHGAAVRISCHQCNQTTDITNTRIRGLSWSVVRERGVV
jgi:hypothetical protein